MKNKRYSVLLPTLAMALIPAADANTTFLLGGDAVSYASWDTWSWGDAAGQNVTGQSGSQGAAQSSSGSIGITSSDVTTTILADFDNPPGGFLGNPDTFYVHNGAYEWEADLTLASSVEYIRVSYSLLGFGGGAPSAFGNAPSTDVGSTIIDTNSYVDAGGSTVFYTDFQLDSPETTFTATFGDALFPGFPGSFRSIDALQVEGFNGAAPATVPEPAAYPLAIALAALTLAVARRRVTRQ